VAVSDKELREMKERAEAQMGRNPDPDARALWDYVRRVSEKVERLQESNLEYQELDQAVATYFQVGIFQGTSAEGYHRMETWVTRKHGG
jgi:hypothetical protein